MFGQALEHSGWWPDYQLRFFKNGAVHWTDKVHTQPTYTGKLVYLPANPQSAIIHHNYQTISQFIQRLDRYTDLELRKRTQSTKSQSFTAKAVVESFSAEFFLRFFVHEGVKDGLHGLSLSFLQSFYEQTVLLKMWQNEKFIDKSTQKEAILALEGFEKDLQYWLADWHFHHAHGLERFYWMIQRKMAS